MKRLDSNILGIALLLIFILIILNSFKINNNTKNIVKLKDNILYLNTRIDSLKTDNNRLRTAHIKTLEFYNYAFYLRKDSIKIDNRGYFYSPYYRKYKHEK